MGIASKNFEPFNNLLERKAHCHRKITIQIELQNTDLWRSIFWSQCSNLCRWLLKKSSDSLLLVWFFSAGWPCPKSGAGGCCSLTLKVLFTDHLVTRDMFFFWIIWTRLPVWLWCFFRTNSCKIPFVTRETTCGCFNGPSGKNAACQRQKMVKQLYAGDICGFNTVFSTNESASVRMSSFNPSSLLSSIAWWVPPIRAWGGIPNPGCLFRFTNIGPRAGVYNNLAGCRGHFTPSKFDNCVLALDDDLDYASLLGSLVAKVLVLSYIYGAISYRIIISCHLLPHGTISPTIFLELPILASEIQPSRGRFPWN